MALTALLDADGLSRLGYDEDSWWAFVEQVAETLDIGPGSRVWDATCGAGSFLFPLPRNGFVGVDRSGDRVALASAAMPDGDVGPRRLNGGLSIQARGDTPRACCRARSSGGPGPLPRMPTRARLESEGRR